MADDCRFTLLCPVNFGKTWIFQDLSLRFQTLQLFAANQFIYAFTCNRNSEACKYTTTWRKFAPRFPVLCSENYFHTGLKQFLFVHSCGSIVGFKAFLFGYESILSNKCLPGGNSYSYLNDSLYIYISFRRPLHSSNESLRRLQQVGPVNQWEATKVRFSLLRNPNGI